MAHPLISAFLHNAPPPIRPLYGQGAVSWIGLAAIHLPLLQWEARREEHHTQATHGKLYSNYRARVGGFLPRSLKGYRTV